MRRLLPLLIILAAFAVRAQEGIDFDRYFQDKTIGLEYMRVGCKQWDTLSDLRHGSFWAKNSQWAGSKKHLIDPFNNGDYYVEVREQKSGRVLYSKGYNTLFREYCDTPEGDSVVASYRETVLIPMPKVPVDVVLRKRDKNLVLHDQRSYPLDPENMYFYRRVNMVTIDPIKVHHSGDIHQKMDIVIVGQGYMNDPEKLEGDLKIFADNLFAVEPFRSHKDDINVWGIAGEAGAEFNTFGADRYCMTKDVWDLHEILDRVVYDQIIIMVNSETYGGGAIYNWYAVSSMNKMCGKIMPHELGHSIGGLADEYVDEGLAYSEMHRTDLEPLEPNITTLVDFASKWKDMLPEGTKIPTKPVRGLGPKDNGALGVYEGAGYQAKGIYRPVTNCMMNYYADFCPVCTRRLEEVIRRYCE